MRQIPVLAVLGLLCLGGPASAQNTYDYDANAGAYPEDPAVLVRFWYEKYLGRRPDRPGMEMFLRNLDQGTPPIDCLGSILGSQGYYDKVGDTPEGFARGLFRDVVGRQPTPREMDWAVGRLYDDPSEQQRGTIAHDLLLRYPQAITPPPRPQAQQAPPPIPAQEWKTHEYRRPDWRYRR
jgi:hypothetical protein